ncbi:MAG: hypothetical protein HON94_01000 [Methylococcales bacterium]|jgi:hypothetical protein|nr:hypothetical protein [Methylococcales bacterium]MBT7410858.1 hypothetical protein [Methylococcales bacterium]
MTHYDGLIDADNQKHTRVFTDEVHKRNTHRETLKECLQVLNKLPNYFFPDTPNKSTYGMASKIEKVLADVDYE